jgi:hypothetical protein
MSLGEALLRVLLGVAAAYGVGAAASRAITRGLTAGERAAWSLATGLLIQAACLVLLLAAGVGPRAVPLLLAEAVVAAAALFLTRGARAVAVPRPEPPQKNALVAVLLGVAFAAWAIFLVGALADTMWATDFVAFWGYKGKVVFLTEEIPRRLFQDPALYFAHKEYPLLVPLSLASLAGWIGEWNDQALALLFPVCEAVTLLAIFGFLSRRVATLSGATAAALASLCFFLYRPANAGTAEVPFALGLVLLVTAALDFLSRDTASSAWRLAVAALFCASLKQEGTLFATLVAITLFLQLRRVEPKAGRRAAAALVLPAAAHWIVLYLLRGNQTRRDFDFTLFTPSRWPELPSIFVSVVGRMLGTEGRNVLPAILALVVFFLATRRGLGDPLVPAFAIQMLFYAVAFTVSSFDPMYAIDGAFRRITMSLFPAFAIVLGARLGALLDSARSGMSPPVQRTAVDPARG